jgi:hypothetical protein
VETDSDVGGEEGGKATGYSVLAESLDVWTRDEKRRRDEGQKANKRQKEERTRTRTTDRLLRTPYGERKR